MQDHQRQVVVLYARSELGDPVGDHTPGLRCHNGGFFLLVCVSAHGVIITPGSDAAPRGCEHNTGAPNGSTGT